MVRSDLDAEEAIGGDHDDKLNAEYACLIPSGGPGRRRNARAFS